MVAASSASSFSFFFRSSSASDALMPSILHCVKLWIYGRLLALLLQASCGGNPRLSFQYPSTSHALCQTEFRPSQNFCTFQFPGFVELGGPVIDLRTCFVHISGLMLLEKSDMAIRGVVVTSFQQYSQFLAKHISPSSSPLRALPHPCLGQKH